LIKFGHEGEGTVYQRQIWSFGMLDRNTKEARVIVIRNNRTAARLIPIIQQNVFTSEERKTRIYSDHFASYNHLAYHNYKHIRINYSEAYAIDPK